MLRGLFLRNRHNLIGNEASDVNHRQIFSLVAIKSLVIDHFELARFDPARIRVPNYPAFPILHSVNYSVFFYDLSFFFSEMRHFVECSWSSSMTREFPPFKNDFDLLLRYNLYAKYHFIFLKNFLFFIKCRNT